MLVLGVLVITLYGEIIFYYFLSCNTTLIISFAAYNLHLNTLFFLLRGKGALSKIIGGPLKGGDFRLAVDNGTLRYAFATLEGSNLLQHIIATPHTPLFCLSYFALDLVWLDI